jgi:hypothetical protein
VENLQLVILESGRKSQHQGDQAMQQDESEVAKNRFDSGCEIVILSLIAIGVYVGGVLFLGKPISHRIPWFWGPLGIFAVLGFDTIWLVATRLHKPQSLQLKIAGKILSVVLFALSGSLLTLWLILKLLSSIRW